MAALFVLSYYDEIDEILCLRVLLLAALRLGVRSSSGLVWSARFISRRILGIGYTMHNYWGYD